MVDRWAVGVGVVNYFGGSFGVVGVESLVLWGSHNLVCFFLRCRVDGWVVEVEVEHLVLVKDGWKGCLIGIGLGFLVWRRGRIGGDFRRMLARRNRCLEWSPGSFG